MKILYHHRTRAGDAQGIHIAEIQRAFRLRGHEVREVALVEAGAEAKADAEGGEARGLAGLASRAAAHMPAAVKESLELAYNAVAYRRLSRALREFRPDFVYERYAANTFAGLAAARRHGVPFVLEVNSPLAQEKAEHDGLFFRGVTRRIERRLCAGADVTIAVTRVLGDILEAQGVPAGKIVVMPNGVRREFGTDGDGAGFRRRLGIPRRGDRRRLHRLVPRLARPRAADRGGGLARVARGGDPSPAGRRRPGDARPARDARRLARSRTAGGPLRPGAARRDRVGAGGLRRRRAAGGDLLRLPDEDPGVHGRRPRHRRAGVGQRPRAP